MLVGRQRGYRPSDEYQPTNLTDLQKELQKAQVEHGFDLELHPKSWSFDDTIEMIGNIGTDPDFVYSVARAKSPDGKGPFKLAGQLKELEYSPGGYIPIRLELEAPTLSELIGKLKQAVHADLAKVLAPLGLEIKPKK